MTSSNIAHPHANTHRIPSIGPHATFAVLISAAALPVVLLWAMPGSVLLPALSLLSFAIAGGLSLLAWLVQAERRTSHMNLWDVAGAYVFIGCAAGMLSRPEHVLELFGVATGAR